MEREALGDSHRQLRHDKSYYVTCERAYRPFELVHSILGMELLCRLSQHTCWPTRQRFD